MANLRLITEGIDLHTIDAVTSEATGYEKEYLQDRKLATSWKATSTDDQYIDIDTEDDDFSASYCFLYHNIHHNGTSAQVWVYSDDNPNFTSPTSRGNIIIFEGGSTPYALILFSGDINERYWRIKITGSDVAPQVYLIFLGSAVAGFSGITIRYKLGQSEEKIYDGVKLITTPGGYRSARQYHIGRKIFEYEWEHLDVTDEAALQAAIGFTNGKGLPFFLGDIDASYHYVRFMNDRIGSIMPYSDFYNTGRIMFQEEF